MILIGKFANTLANHQITSSMTSTAFYFAVFKPYGMLSQFTAEAGHTSLKSLYEFPIDVYPVGRLDTDSEGLLLLTNDKRMNHRLLNPDFGHKRTYIVQVDGDITEEACRQLDNGVDISVDGKKYFTKSISTRKVAAPEWLPERNPPVRFRKLIPTSWIEMVLSEGKNRQVRKMTAAAGYPALRLVRTSIESLELGQMKPSEVKQFSRTDFYKLLNLR
jgi:23S rRNA pseudouridine2457 synthase